MTAGNTPYLLERRGSGSPVKMWTRGVPVEHAAKRQLHNTAALPFVYRHVVAMPDVHVGIGATVGSVIPTRKALIPASVGVDIGCGMMATRLDGANANHLPDSLAHIRHSMERTIPTGRNGYSDSRMPDMPGFALPMLDFLKEKHPGIARRKRGSVASLIRRQFGTLGGGNHFIELCLDENEELWVMLHSGSRGIGNAIGNYFIERAKEEMRRHFVNLPDVDLAYFEEGSAGFDDYWFALEWAQMYADRNRRRMMALLLECLRHHLPPFDAGTEAISCHHNYAARERHFGEEVYVTRKGAVRAGIGDMGIIPGSMGTRSYIVRGKGEAESFESCSHGAGRTMSRRQAKQQFSLEQHARATQGVECRKDAGVLDETPAAYKDIDAVMEAQRDLVDVVHTLKQVVCVKG